MLFDLRRQNAVHIEVDETRRLLSSRFGLEIRAATSADAPGLAELLTACGITVSARELAERLEDFQHDRGAALVALEWGPPSGLVAVHWHQTLVAARPIAEITTLIVGCDNRRRGVGRLLLKAAARSARVAECETLRLFAGLDLTDLRGFCVANGFVEDAVGFVRPLRKRASYPDE